MKRLFFVVVLAVLFFIFAFAGLALADGPLIGEIRIWAGSPLPSGWLYCDGLAISRTQYADLFNVISTTYGAGDGSTTFSLPALNSRFVLGSSDMCNGICSMGIGPYPVAATGGEISHTLTITETPVHSHTIHRSVTAYLPSGTTTGWPGHHGGGIVNYGEDTNTAGGGAAHNNMPPYLAVNFIIAYTTTQTTPTPTPTPTVTPTATTTPTNTPTPTATPVGVATPDTYTYPGYRLNSLPTG